MTLPRPLHTRLHGRRDTPSSRPISFDAAPSSTAGVSLDVDFVVERAGGGFALAKKSLNVQGDMDELMAAFKEALGTQDTGGAGDVRGSRRRHLHVHEGPRVQGGRAVEEEPRAHLRRLLRR